MTSPLAAKATFSRHAACEMWKKQRQFFCRNVIFSVLQYLSPCSATTPFFFFSPGWHWPCIMVSFHITPAIFSFRCPKTWPFPMPAFSTHTFPHPHPMPTLLLEIQLTRGAFLCWEEPWAWRGIWQIPKAPQGCSSKELHHEKGTCPTVCQWQTHIAKHLQHLVQLVVRFEKL